MRIIHEIEHPRMKITCFQYEGKYSIKFEKHQQEILTKFRDLPVEITINQIADAIGQEDFNLIEKQLDEMVRLQNSWLSSNAHNEDFSFPEII